MRISLTFLTLCYVIICFAVAASASSPKKIIKDPTFKVEKEIPETESEMVELEDLVELEIKKQALKELFNREKRERSLPIIYNRNSKLYKKTIENRPSRRKEKPFGLADKKALTGILQSGKMKDFHSLGLGKTKPMEAKVDPEHYPLSEDILNEIRIIEEAVREAGEKEKEEESNKIPEQISKTNLEEAEVIHQGKHGKLIKRKIIKRQRNSPKSSQFVVLDESRMAPKLRDVVEVDGVLFRNPESTTDKDSNPTGASSLDHQYQSKVPSTTARPIGEFSAQISEGPVKSLQLLTDQHQQTASAHDSLSLNQNFPGYSSPLKSGYESSRYLSSSSGSDDAKLSQYRAEPSLVLSSTQPTARPPYSAASTTYAPTTISRPSYSASTTVWSTTSRPTALPLSTPIGVHPSTYPPSSPRPSYSSTTTSPPRPTYSASTTPRPAYRFTTARPTIAKNQLPTDLSSLRPSKNPGKLRFEPIVYYKPAEDATKGPVYYKPFPSEKDPRYLFQDSFVEESRHDPVFAQATVRFPEENFSVPQTMPDPIRGSFRTVYQERRSKRIRFPSD